MIKIFFTHKSILNGFKNRESGYTKKEQEDTDFPQIFEKELMKREGRTSSQGSRDK